MAYPYPARRYDDRGRPLAAPHLAHAATLPTWHVPEGETAPERARRIVRRDCAHLAPGDIALFAPYDSARAWWRGEGRDFLRDMRGSMAAPRGLAGAR